MTNNNVNPKVLMTIIIGILVISIGITPVFAHNPPYKDDYWFNNNGDPEICYLEYQLARLTVDNGSGNYQDVEDEVDDARQAYNSKVSGLTIAAEDDSCDYNRIEVGAKDLGWGVMAQAVLTAYYCCSWSVYGQYAEQEFDLGTNYEWEVESDGCDWQVDKDIEWIANHELGHTLSLDHHSNGETTMSIGCDSDWGSIDSETDSALEARYN